MAIDNIIDGSKNEVKGLYAYADGIWKECKTVHNNIDGIWKQTYPDRKTFTIQIYNYGNPYQTLECREGESIQLPSIGVGFAISSGSTVRTYNSGATITPTENMNLYVVYQYQIRLYKYGSLYTTLTQYSQSTTASFTLTASGITNQTGFYGWSTASNATSRQYTSGQVISSSGTTLYAVWSFQFIRYRYGSVISNNTYYATTSTYTVNTGTATVSGDDTSLYGWTLTNGSTSITYNYNTNISISPGITSIYAVFQYKKITITEKTLSSNRNVETATTAAAGTIKITGSAHVTPPTGNSGTYPITISSTSSVYAKINGKFINGTSDPDKDYLIHSSTYPAGTTIEIKGNNSSAYSVESVYVYYQGANETTGYRSTM